MAKKRPLCCVIGYETVDGSSWKATILAYSVEKAVEFLYKEVKHIARINSTEGSREVDAFHDEVRRDYLTENVVNEVEVEVEVIKEVPIEVIREVEVIKEVPVEISKGNEDDGNITCPWCKKGFKNEKTLKTHCIKFHLKDEK